jgi:hypothetical protein
MPHLQYIYMYSSRFSEFIEILKSQRVGLKLVLTGEIPQVFYYLLQKEILKLEVRIIPYPIVSHQDNFLFSLYEKGLTAIRIGVDTSVSK